MAIAQVKQYFQQWGMEQRVMEFATSCATVEEAAKSVNCAPERIAKTLSFQVNEQVILVVMAGDARIDNAKFKAFFHVKARMLPAESTEAVIGHAAGGVCPFAIHAGIAVYLDISLRRFTTVFPSCGASNSAIELNLAELEQFSNAADWVDVCKNWQ